MSSRASLNKVLLIGNLTRDPELRYTPSGAAVCTFGIATNRFYVASDGEKKEETEFIKIVSWNKLAELCSQLLAKGRKVYVEGRLQTRSWETPDGQNRQTTEVVIDDMRILDSKREFEGASEGSGYSASSGAGAVETQETGIAHKVADSTPQEKSKSPIKKVSKGKDEQVPKEDKDDKKDEDIDLEDLPF